MGTGKKLIKQVGSLLARVIVLAACLMYLLSCARELDADNFKWSFLVNVLAGSLAYWAATFILAFNWCYIVMLLSDNKCSRAFFLKVYFESVLAKYIPSNVMHLAARHYQLKKNGFSHQTAFLSNVLELALVIISSAIIIAPMFFSKRLILPDVIVDNKNWLSMLLIGGTIFSGFVLVYYCRKNGRLSHWQMLAQVIRIMFLYGVFLILSGIIFSYISSCVISDWSWASLPVFMFAYVCAWSIGLVTPGAPGGLGVREVMLVVLLSGHSAKPEILLAALLFRMASVIGELLGFVYARFLSPGSKACLSD
ncbi:MAG: hypothetical protein JW745_07345 [Sedimentisphaerales bacterium]|nr:hypothetical protein [Sedimentisphaerales bacterium]MBN2841881.1 hypothetical protein [Sedimentisphaerales bacterium]